MIPLLHLSRVSLLVRTHGGEYKNIHSDKAIADIVLSQATNEIYSKNLV